MKVAVRRPDGEIVSMVEPVSTIYAGRLQKTPLLRGIFALIEALILGVKALRFSAKIAAELELEEELFITYLALISRIPDIRRVFAYHGAEHKAVNAFEAGATMTVENVQRYSTSHTRCGTGFLLMVMVIAIMVFVFTGQPALWLRLLSRLALLPVIAAIGYELIHLAANHTGNRIIRAVMAPGLALQSLTTRQPDSEQVEVAIAALEGVIETEE
ncbi:DUF1385 domain-containing protein [Dehalococcoidia bacterium]|nr:DUF1385 domain-containing protein [Dehalococcoidia bacterium]MCL0065180.1 DUF1385 domain-containing protein [Dehalococcoidia bacterium]